MELSNRVNLAFKCGDSCLLRNPFSRLNGPSEAAPSIGVSVRGQDSKPCFNLNERPYEEMPRMSFSGGT